MLTVTINDEEIRFENRRSLDQVLREQGLPEKGFAVMVNGCFVSRERHRDTVLEDGDEVHILAPMSGG